jgi:hypothetical protein
MELIIETGSTILRSGNCVIQRATIHGWRVHGDQPCVSATVLIAKEKDEKTNN